MGSARAKRCVDDPETGRGAALRDHDRARMKPGRNAPQPVVLPGKRDDLQTLRLEIGGWRAAREETSVLRTLGLGVCSRQSRAWLAARPWRKRD